MSDAITIELTEQAKAVLRKLGTLPAWGMAAMAKGMDEANQMALANVTKKHLTGKGPFPVEEHKLGVVSNNLRLQAYATAAAVTGTKISSAMGSPVKYAALHEYGGVVHHKARKGTARLRTDAKGNLLKQMANANLAVFAKASHKKVKEVEYQAEAYDVTVPERAPFRTGIREVLAEYGRMLSDELVAAWGARA